MFQILFGLHGQAVEVVLSLYLYSCYLKMITEGLILMMYTKTLNTFLFIIFVHTYQDLILNRSFYKLANDPDLETFGCYCFALALCLKGLNSMMLISQKTLTMFVGVVALTLGVVNRVPQLPQT